MINTLKTQRNLWLVPLAALLLLACEPASESEIIAIGNGDGGSQHTDIAMDASTMDGAAEMFRCSDPGCACAPNSAPQSCFPEPIRTVTGATVCTQGAMYCRAGTWSGCEALIQFGLASTPAPSTPAVTNANPETGNGPTLNGIRSALIADASACDTCHPDCFKALDRPVDTDLTASNSSQIAYDPGPGGIRLTIVGETAQRGSLTMPAVCGNRIAEGVEQCDDGNATSGDGCNSTCRLEVGYFCPTVGSACTRSVCGNGVPEGLEACDDGNKAVGDGCTYLCTKEPSCVSGQACSPVCGDGQVFPGEACDDGNANNGDGCSSTCTLEADAGFYCVNATSAPPPTLDIPIVYHDFAGIGLVQYDGGRAPDGGSLKASDGGIIYAHTDFQHVNKSSANLVQATWDSDAGSPTYKKPLFASAIASDISGYNIIQSAGSFGQWYTDDPVVNKTFNDVLTVTRSAMNAPDGGPSGSYAFDTTAFFPLDGKAGTWTALGQEKQGLDGSNVAHNFSFTSELRFWFVYNPPQTLDFRGDDDVWVFINGRRAVDIGGVHGAATGAVTLNSGNAATFGLVSGKLYEAAVFQAERHTTGSNYRLTLSGFFSGKTTCTTRCGDGIVTPDEFCDDGAANGTAVGACLSDCQGRSPVYASSASYWRDYAATSDCDIPPERPLWGLLNWTVVPLTGVGGSGITFRLQGAETSAGVVTATPVSVTLPLATASGSFNIHDALVAAGALDDPPYLRVTAVLTASTDKKTTPVLKNFDVSHTCVNVE